MTSASFKEEKFREKSRRLKSASNKFLYGFLAVFLIGYIFFFSSSLWLPKSYSGVYVTPIGTAVRENDRIITVDRWVYCPEAKTMEIIVEMENNSIDGITDYTWQLKDKNGLIKTEVIGEYDSFTVIHGIGIKRGWTEVSLTLAAASEYGETNFTPVVIYMNDKVAPVVLSLEEKTMEEYIAAAYESKIDGFNNAILSLGEEIAGKESEIAEVDSRIDELIQRLDYQTEQEQEETSSLITSLSQQKTNLSNEIDKLRTEIEELEQKIQITKTILEELNNKEG